MLVLEHPGYQPSPNLPASWSGMRLPKLFFPEKQGICVHISFTDMARRSEFENRLPNDWARILLVRPDRIIYPSVSSTSPEEVFLMVCKIINL